MRVEQARSLLIETAIWGYHVYRVLWEPHVGETVLHESGNDHDRHAMAVYRREDLGVIMGHLPREISKTCNYFTRSSLVYWLSSDVCEVIWGFFGLPTGRFGWRGTSVSL